MLTQRHAATVVASRWPIQDSKDGRGQATQFVVDARGQAGMTQEVAERGIGRAMEPTTNLAASYNP